VCEHVVLSSPHPWDPRRVNMSVSSLSHVHTDLPNVPTDCDRILLSRVSTALVELKEALTSKIRISSAQRLSQLQTRSEGTVIRDPEHATGDTDIPARHTFVSKDRHQKITADLLADRWCIGPHRAQATLRATQQRGVRSAILPLARRYRADRMYNVKRLDGKFSTDTFYATVRSLRSEIGAQVYFHKVGFAAVYPIRETTGQELGYTLLDFIHEFGAPSHLTFDGHPSQVGPRTLFRQTINRAQINFHISQPRRPNENPAEGGIREIKKRWYRIMMKRDVPKRLWDFGIQWVCETKNLTVSSSRYARGRTPLEIITGDTPDITEYLDFGFYDWVYYRSNAGLGPSEIGRWLGLSKRVGPLMSYWILPRSGIPISVTTVQRITNLELQTDPVIRACDDFTQHVSQRLDAPTAAIGYPNVREERILDSTAEDPEFLKDFNRVINNPELKEQEDIDAAKAATDANRTTEFDPYLRMEIGLPRGPDGELQHATVRRRLTTDEGVPIGRAHSNPLMDSRVYEVEYLDGATEVLAANIIAENLLAQVDEEGHRHMMLDEIIDHRKDEAVAIPKSDGFFTTPNGLQRRKRTTRGWEICVQWKDGSTDWIALKDLKDSYPVELAEYAVTAKIDDEPAFAWWINYTLKKRERIIKKLKTKYWDRSHKFGIRIPKSVEEALEIDKQNGDTYWKDAIEKEMKNVKIAFELYDGDVRSLIGYQEIRCHMIFDIKLSENFRRKARYVAGGHTTDTPSAITYSSVVSRDSVRICLLLAALNGLDILAGDIQNAYLTAPNREKIYTRAGLEFGQENVGKPYLIVRALYGLKSSGAAFRAHLAKHLDEIGFKPSEADPDVWMRPAVKPSGETYWEYILCYVDDVSCVSHSNLGDRWNNYSKRLSSRTTP